MIQLFSANPSRPRKKKAKTATGRKAPKKGASTMAKRRTAAQKAATRKLVAWVKAHKHGKKHKTTNNPARHYKAKKRNPTTVHHKQRKTSRNPSIFRGGILGELISKDGLLMVAGAFAAPMATDFLQEKIMPTATGWTKVALKAGLVVAGAFAIDKFLKMRKAALAYGVTGLAVVASDAVDIARGVMHGLSADEADMLANRPDLIAAAARGGLGGPYQTGLAGDYSTGLAAGNQAFPGAFRGSFGRAA